MVGADLPFMQLLLMVLSAGSVNANDWMMMVQPAEYFKSRRIEPTLDRMIDFAIADIKTPKAQIRQLAALMHLQNESERFKSAKNYESNRMAIEEVAAGQRGADPAGFGQEYAQRLLDKLDGKKIAPPKHQPLRLDALDWFPADTRLALAFDMRNLQDISGHARKEILATLSEYYRLHLYDQLESMGNVRVDRTAFGIVDGGKAEQQKTFIRISGKGNQAWIADALNERAGDGLEVKTSKASDGTPIMTLTSPLSGAACVLIGNTDMVVVSYEQFERRHDELVEEVLAVRAKKKPHAAAGALKDRLAKVPDKAIGFLVGDLPASMKEELGKLVEPMPANFSVYAERTEQGIELKLEAALKDGVETGKFTEKVGALRKEGIDGLQKAMKAPPPGGIHVPYPSLLTLVESVQVEKKGTTAHVRGFMSNQLIRDLGQMYATFNNGAQREAPK